MSASHGENQSPTVTFTRVHDTAMMTSASAPAQMTKRRYVGRRRAPYARPSAANTKICGLKSITSEGIAAMRARPARNSSTVAATPDISTRLHWPSTTAWKPG